MPADKSVIDAAREKTELFLLDESAQDEQSELIKLLRRSGRSNKEFETMVSNLAFEDLIALKLELSFRAVKKGLYGLPVLSGLTQMTKDAFITAALSRSPTKAEAARSLGIRYCEFVTHLARYLTREIFAAKGKELVRDTNSNTKDDPIFNSKER